jgi:hypothetical protein
MPEKVKPLGVKREQGWLYFLDDDGDVSRQLEDGGETIEKVAYLGFKIEDDDANLYFVDEEGDLASQTVAEYETEAANRWKGIEDEIRKEYESRNFQSAFKADENRYWIVKGNRRVNDLRDMLEPQRVHTWRTARLPRDIEVGDRLVFWESAPHLRVVGIGEVGAWEREKDIFGNSHFWIVYQSRFVEGGPSVNELRKDPSFASASFLKAAVAGTLFPLEDAQAEVLAHSLSRLDPGVRAAWPDACDSASGASAPEAPRAPAARSARPKKQESETKRPRVRKVEAEGADEDEADEEAEKVCQAGITTEDGWIYTVVPKGIFRVPEDNPDARRQWVHKASIKVEDGYVYFVDEDGDAARLTYEGARAIVLRDKLAARTTPGLRQPMDIPSVSLKSGETYRILSVHPPWAWSILFAGKDIENRSWSTPYRGPILIHASSRKYVGNTLDEVRRAIAKCSGIPIERVPTDFPRSQILGMVDVIDCVQYHESPWAEGFGALNWILERPRQLANAVENVDGKLNLWSWTCP